MLLATHSPRVFETPKECQTNSSTPILFQNGVLELFSHSVGSHYFQSHSLLLHHIIGPIHNTTKIIDIAIAEIHQFFCRLGTPAAGATINKNGLIRIG